MASTSSSVVVQVGPSEAFDTLTDFSRFGEWLAFHDSWRGEPPTRESLRQGQVVESVLAIKDAKAPFDWTIDTFEPGKVLRFSGKQKGIKIAIELRVAVGLGSTEVIFGLELGGVPMIGPVGKSAVKAASGDVEESLRRFAAMVDG